MCVRCTMFCNLAFSKLLVLLGLAIVLIHIILLGLAIVIHVVLMVPCLRKAAMKHGSCCK